MFSFIGHWLLGWLDFVSEQKAHGEPIEVGQYLVSMGRETLENWQSEFLQLLWQVLGLTYFLYIGSPQSKEEDDRIEDKLDAILTRIDPAGAEELIRKLDEKYPGRHIGPKSNRQFGRTLAKRCSGQLGARRHIRASPEALPRFSRCLLKFAESSDVRRSPAFAEEYLAILSMKPPATLPAAAAPETARERRRPGLAAEIVETLSGAIRSGQLPPATKLPTEAEIMARFSVSRTVVREALSKLQASGLVETRHGIGTFVLAAADAANFRINAEDFATVADVISVLELRISLETEAAGLAAQRRSEENLQAMKAALQAFHASMDAASDAVPSDFQFHLEVARATGNRHFADLMDYLGTMIIPRTRINTAHAAPEGRLAYLQRVHGEHENIFVAIRNRDAEGARAAMRMHLSNSRERLRRGGGPDPAQQTLPPSADR